MNKKLLALMLSITLIFLMTTHSIGIAYSEKNKSFNYARLERLDGYEFDKENQTWKYIGLYGKEWANAAFGWAIYIDGDTLGTITDGQPWTALQWHSKDRGNELIETFIIAIDNKLYSYENITDTGNGWSMLFLGNIGLNMIESISKAKEVTIFAEHSGYTSSFEVDINEFKAMKTWALNFEKERIGTYCDVTELNWADEEYRAYME